jgi:predicted dehydrogenase
MQTAGEKLKVRTAVIGTGKMGQFHLAKLAAHPESHLIGIFDSDAEKARTLAARFGIRFYENLNELLFEADAVVIATPTESHHTLAKDALNAGVHVLVEKPIASTAAQAEALVQLAKSQNLLLMVGHLERYRLRHFLTELGLNPAPDFLFVEADRLHTDGGREQNRIDVVSDLMIHDLDLILSLKASAPTSVSAIGMPVSTSLVDIANARLEFADGAVANVSTSRVSTHMQRKFRIYGGNFYASLDFLNQSATCRYSSSVAGVSGGDLKSKTVEIKVDCLEKQTDELLRCVADRTQQPLVSGQQALEALRWTERVQAAVHQRTQLLQPVRAKEPASWQPKFS